MSNILIPSLFAIIVKPGGGKFNNLAIMIIKIIKVVFILNVNGIRTIL